MNQQVYTGYIHSTSEQVQSGSGKVQPQSEQAQFGRGQVQSRSGQVQSGSGQVQSGSEKAQSSSTSMAAQMLKNKNKRREEIKPVDKEKQKVELEKPLESNRRFNQINEEIIESYDKQNAKLKQREEDMWCESLRKVEAKYYPDLDQTKGRESYKDLDQSKDSDSDRESSSSDGFVYVQKPKTNNLNVKLAIKS